MDCWVHVLKEKQCGVNFLSKQTTRQHDIHIELKIGIFRPRLSLQNQFLQYQSHTQTWLGFCLVGRVGGLRVRSPLFHVSHFRRPTPSATSYIVHRVDNRTNNRTMLPTLENNAAACLLSRFPCWFNVFFRIDFQAQNDPRMKEAEIMSIPVIGGAGSWGGNSTSGVEENPMVRFR